MTEPEPQIIWHGASHSAEQTMALGAAIARVAQDGDLIALIGELGAGKTQWVRGMAQALGIAPAALASPTFVMVQEYSASTPGAPVLVHIDAYRLRTLEDLESIGWDVTGASELRRGAIVVIEWADRIAGTWGHKALEVRLAHAGTHEREIEVAGSGTWIERLAAIASEMDAAVKADQTDTPEAPDTPDAPDAPATASATKNACPICGKAVAADTKTRPFCSDRCRLIDLGRWLGGGYRISRPLDSNLDDAE